MNEYFHVTEREDANAILVEGFLGGWGDAGYGVYAFDNIHSAVRYAGKGGWDERLKDPVIIVFATNDMAQIIPEPSWPNPEDYATISWKKLDEDIDEQWRPDKIEIIDMPLEKSARKKP